MLFNNANHLDSCPIGPQTFWYENNLVRKTPWATSYRRVNLSWLKVHSFCCPGGFDTPRYFRPCSTTTIDLHSLFGLHVHSCTHWLRRPRNRSSPTTFGFICWVSQDRRHLFVTTWSGGIVRPRDHHPKTGGNTESRQLYTRLSILFVLSLALSSGHMLTVYVYLRVRN